MDLQCVLVLWLAPGVLYAAALVADLIVERVQVLRVPVLRLVIVIGALWPAVLVWHLFNLARRKHRK